MEGLHIQLISPLSRYNEAAGILGLPGEGDFGVSIKEYEDKLKLEEQIVKLQKEKLKASGYDKKEIEDKLKPLLAEKKKLDAIDFKGVRWVWMLADGMVLNSESYNEGLAKGSVRHDGRPGSYKPMHFPKVLEGGGLAYMEPYLYDPVTEPDSSGKAISTQYQPQGKAPFGCFVYANAAHIEVLAAEWKDKYGNNITEEVRFGSTVYLHVYTQGLYGQALKIKLKDTYKNNNDLHLSESDANGLPIEKHEENPDDLYFVRKVDVFSYNPETQPQLVPPVSNDKLGYLIPGNRKKNEKTVKSYPCVQKCVFPVFIEPKWQFQGAQANSEYISWVEDGSTLEINPVVYHPGIKDGEIEFGKCVLTVSKEKGIKYPGELAGNSPVTTTDHTPAKAKDGRKRVDFTFGVFIDGTNNSKYNTVARQEWESAQISPEEEKADPFGSHINKAAHSQKTVDAGAKKNAAKINGDDGMKEIKLKDSTGKAKYRYSDDSSYENDLSNPAILYEYYKDDPNNATAPVIRVYSEGMGTGTEAVYAGLKEGEKIKPEEDGTVKDYKGDSKTGGAVGQGETGMLSRVRRAIDIMVNKINLASNRTIGTITIDVFGFSRGAAAARIFVHEIFLQPYFATWDTNYETWEAGWGDHNQNKVTDEYADFKKQLPAHGRLGYKLTEKGLTADNIIVRFAGLFDSVPHHGPFSQSNDREELGLDDVARALYTVHLVAGDEHRHNFSLVDISGITGELYGGESSRGIELFLPGVHCDVGGSYVEGRPETNYTLKNYDSKQKFDDDMKWMIGQGWYTKEQLTVTKFADENYSMKGSRPYLSNQYSFIPLHVMLEFALKKGVVIKEGNLYKKYDFTLSPSQKKYLGEDNIVFLKKIKGKIWDYAFNKGNRFRSVSPKKFSQPPFTCGIGENERQKREEYNEAQRKGQAGMDAAAAALNKDISRLRNNYLHFNANYDGMPINHPHFKTVHASGGGTKEVRSRVIRGEMDPDE